MNNATGISQGGNIPYVTPTEINTMTEKTSTIRNKLNKLESMIIEINGRLFGQTPQSVNDEAKEAIPNIQNNLNKIDNTIDSMGVWVEGMLKAV